jgi:acylphosphatase
MKAVSLRIVGRVQGVGFRYFVLRTAKQLGVNGYVMNCSNGDVYVEAEADDQVILEFVDYCRKGPSHSDVTDIVIREIETKGYSDFEIEG